MCRRQITLSKIDEICPFAIPNQISAISMHKPSLEKIHRNFLKLSSRNENTDVRQMEGQMDGQYVCVDVLWPSQPNGVMSSTDSLPTPHFYRAGLVL